MNSTIYIPVQEICLIHQIEFVFIQHLSEYGLLEITVHSGKEFIHQDYIPVLERFIFWYKDLEINLPGLEVLSQILPKLNRLQEENRNLREEVQFYHSLYFRSLPSDYDPS